MTAWKWKNRRVHMQGLGILVEARLLQGSLGFRVKSLRASELRVVYDRGMDAWGSTLTHFFTCLLCPTTVGQAQKIWDITSLVVLEAV